MNFPAWQLFLKTLPQKCWPQYLGNYTDNTDGTYTYLGNYTDGRKWDCIHKYTYEIKKYFFQIHIDNLPKICSFIPHLKQFLPPPKVSSLSTK